MILYKIPNSYKLKSVIYKKHQKHMITVICITLYSNVIMLALHNGKLTYKIIVLSSVCSLYIFDHKFILATKTYWEMMSPKSAHSMYFLLGCVYAIPEAINVLIQL